MPQSLARVVVHVVFATKGRARCLRPAIREALYDRIAAILAEHRCLAIRIGGVDDHVHVLFALARTTSVAAAVEAVKVGSSQWMKGAGQPQFAWQSGYGAFSVGERQVPIIARYIERQPEHHRRITFDDELRRILAHHGIAFDERYLWD